MNAKTQVAALPAKSTTELATPTLGLAIPFQSMQEIIEFSKIMSTAKNAVPALYINNPGACMAVTMQAIRWGMDPFAVAQKTHEISGVMGYEGQLINAVVTAMAPTTGRLQYEWYGDWSKVIGNFIEKTSQKGNKYTAPNWGLAEEKDLGIKVWATMKGESEPRVLDLLLSQAGVRNSTLWATDPKQQLAYLAVKRWARLYCPDVILGVYSPDELQAQPVSEREINPAATEQPAATSRTGALKDKLRGTAADPDDKPADAAPVPQAEPEPEELPLAASATYADVMAAINAADSPESIQAAKALMIAFCGEGENSQFQEELGASYRWKLSELKKAQA